MEDIFLTSSSVKVYPASNRDANVDVYAKLNIEHNLINMINRLTGVDSFIVSGLEISGSTLSAGVCNIHGFLFNLESRSLPSKENNKYLCLKIRVDNSTGKEQLANVADGTSAVDNGSDKFTGICLATYTQAQLDAVEAPFYVLPIAKGVSGQSGWQPIYDEDGLGSNRAFTQLYRADQIMIQSSQASNTYANKRQNLVTFLERNYIIDDGEVD